MSAETTAPATLNGSPRAGGSLIGSCMWTFSGELFDLLHGGPEEVRFPDIAHGLSCIGRFAGQARAFYSVAQHCVLVSRLCDTADAKRGLLHDAPEAYVGDMISPLKRQPGMETYRAIEERIADLVVARFGLECLEPPSVKLADRLAVFLEMEQLMCGTPMKYGRKVARPDLSVLGITIAPLSPTEAERLYLARAEELGIT